MSRYGISYYGANPATGEVTLYGEVIQNEFDATPFTVVSNDYGQTLSTWRKPGGAWTEQRLVRNSNGFPVDVNDGVLLLTQDFDDAERLFTDTELTPGRFYYYALFVFDAHDLIWRIAGSDEVLVAKDFGYSNRLYSQLPEVFRSNDYASVDLADQLDEDSFLYRYLSILGYQLDHVRNESEVLRSLLDARVIPVAALPALAQQVGIGYEPAIGARAVRRLVTNANRLWSLKGTIPGVRELSSLVSGYAASAGIGWNMALDDLDAGPVGGPGRWRVQSGGKVSYKPNDTAFAGPHGTGVLDLEVTTTGLVEIVLDTNRSGGDESKRLQYAIPVRAGRSYVASMYAKTTIGHYSTRAAMRIQWLDKRGRSLGAYIDGGTSFLSATEWPGRAVLVAQAPVGARYLEAQLVLSDTTDGFVPGQHVYACGFQVNEGTAVKPWQCAREVVVQLFAPFRNMVFNPAMRNGTDNWVDGGNSTTVTASAVDDEPTILLEGTGVRYVKPVQVVPAQPGDIWYLRAEVFLSDDGAAFTGGQPMRNGTIIGGFTVDSSPTTGSSWQVVEGYYLVPNDADSFTPRFGGNSNLHVRNVMVTKSAAPITYFDGSTPSETEDNLWQDEPDASVSHHYPQRTARATRLRELLRDYVPYQHCFALSFADEVDLYVAGVAAIRNDRINEGSTPPPPAPGRTLGIVWDIEDANGKSLTAVWNVGLNAVTVDLVVAYAVGAAVGDALDLSWDVETYNALVQVDLHLFWSQPDPIVGGYFDAYPGGYGGT